MPWRLVELDMIALTGWTYEELDAAPVDRLLPAWEMYQTRQKGASARAKIDAAKGGRKK